MTEKTHAWQHGGKPVTDDVIARLDGWFRAANYLSVGQIYLLNNPLLKTPCPATTSNRGFSGTGAPRPD